MNGFIEKYASIVAALIIIGVGAFWSGMRYEAQLHPAPAPGTIIIPPHVANVGAASSNAPRFGTVLGQVISSNASGATVKTVSGSTETIHYTTSTAINMTKVVVLKPADIAAGDNLFVTGMIGTDGSITAQQIQLTPPSPASTAGKPPSTAAKPPPRTAKPPASTPSLPLI
jgi:hypothetical protein